MPTSRRSFATGSRPAAEPASTAATARSRGLRWRCSCSRRSSARTTCRPACTGTVFDDVPCSGGAFDPWIEELAGLAVTERLSGLAAAVLPQRPGQPPADGSFPPEDQERCVLRSARLRRRVRGRPVHARRRLPRLDRDALCGRSHRRLFGFAAALLPDESEHAGARWRSSWSRRSCFPSRGAAGARAEPGPASRLPSSPRRSAPR